MLIYALDDNKIQLKVYQELYGAQIFTDYKQLMDRMRDQRPDLFICDLVMPECDGWTVVYAVQALYPDLPIIIATASTGDEQKALAQFRQCEFWSKCEYGQLKELVNKYGYPTRTDNTVN